MGRHDANRGYVLECPVSIVGSTESETQRKSEPKVRSYYRLEHFQLADFAFLLPRPILTALGQKYEQYLDFAQQDAHEFLRILLDAIRMEEFDVRFE